MPQTILTFITKIDPDKRPELDRILAQIQDDLILNSYIPFSSLELLHFASFVILDDPAFDSCLVFENNFDGSLDHYLETLLQHAGRGLHKIYSCCADYDFVNYEQNKLAGYLTSKVVRPNAFHIGNIGRSVTRIKQERQMREHIETGLDKLLKNSRGPHSPALLRKQILEIAGEDTSLSLDTPMPPRQTPAELYIPWLKVIGFGLGVFLLLPVLIPLFIIWIIVLRMKEKSDPERPASTDAAEVSRLAEREDRIVQNHIAVLTQVKPGWFRRATLRIVLLVANLLARTSNKGKLAGIPSIHFAHWSLIDNDRRLLFLSNYDGSWISYLDDFIDKASYGLTGIWSNTAGFPRTKFLIFDGANNEAEFKTFGRESQAPTLVWYSAYPDLTVQNVDNDSLIREGLYASPDDQTIKDWLRLF